MSNFEKAHFGVPFLFLSGKMIPSHRSRAPQDIELRKPSRQPIPKGIKKPAIRK
ncbi:hypothetical protein NC99_45790 [Sunxiuqinia dokdonensis]|uniref:Uncharacterized protein n=1 Tax=Sunxiuqinia dokdonensis TaxID=1409788 RepID=A0A0L8V2I7_9BACT|nr:hypothetical protein NC99_45790 [Sunxiuqinia dokdonensis]